MDKKDKIILQQLDVIRSIRNSADQKYRRTDAHSLHHIHKVVQIVRIGCYSGFKRRNGKIICLRRRKSHRF